MCRFSVSLAPPPRPDEGLEQLLEDDDGFNWFDAIDEIPELVPQDALAPVAPVETDSSAPASADGPTPQAAIAPAGSGSSASSYDLVEMFKQQVEQQAPSAMASPVAPSFQPQFIGAMPFAAVPQQLMCGIAGPFAGACVAPTFLPAAALAGTPAVTLNNNTVGTPIAAAVPMAGVDSSAAAGTSAGACRSGSAPGSSCGRRSKKTQEEIDAAVERIKQKRRESAQRSRARKNDYMRQLELENQALKDEVQRLQQVLAAVQRSQYQQHHQAAAFVQLGAM